MADRLRKWIAFTSAAIVAVLIGIAVVAAVQSTPDTPSDTTLASVASESVASTTVAPTTTTTVPPAPCDRRVVNGADQGNVCRGGSPAVRSAGSASV